MSKELEAYFKIDHTLCLNSQNIKFGIDADEHIDCQNIDELVNCLETIKKALEERESIDSANPSEALKCLEEIEQKLECYINGGLILLKDDEIKITTIKQALIQATQDKKKATCWDIVVKKNVDVSLIKKYDFVEDYNSAVWIAGRPKLVKEEFDTLKGRLGE